MMSAVVINDAAFVSGLLFLAGILGSFFSWMALKIVSMDRTLVRMEQEIKNDAERRADHEDRIRRIEATLFAPRI
jgi:hypothetical protein